MLISRIIQEPTLNSAAQSVLDEIKRHHDDICTNKDSEREDLILAVRIFDENIKQRLMILDRPLHGTSSQVSIDSNVIFQPNDSDDSDNELLPSLDSSDPPQRPKAHPALNPDQTVRAYINMNELKAALESNADIMNSVDKFCADLSNLINQESPASSPVATKF